MKLATITRIGTGLVLLTVASSMAVDGISVSTHWSGDNKNLYGGYGDIVKHVIRDSRVVSNTVLYDGDARYPTINQSGTHVAFIKKSGKVSLIGIDGGAVTDLVDIPDATGYLDWPTGSWVWYSKGGYSHSGSAEVWKVNVDTRQTQRVITWEKSGGSLVRQWNWSVSRDGSRMMIRCNDGDGNFNRDDYGDIFWIKVPSSTPKDIILGNGSSADRSQNFDGCGVAMNPSGTVGCFFGSKGHGGLDFTNWWQSSRFLALSGSQLNSWGEDMGGSYNRTRWSANSDKWVCVMSGWCCRGDGGSNQVLYNYIDHEQVAVTHNAAKSYQNDDAGDFWVGDPGGTTTPAMSLSPTSLAFSAEQGGAAPSAKTVTVGNSGDGTLDNVTTSVSYASGNGWLSVARQGSGNTQSLSNTVSIATLAAGSYAATVTVRAANADPQSVTYDVTLEVLAPQTLREPDNPPNAGANGLVYEYFEGQWTMLPDFASLTPVSDGVVDNFDISIAARDEQFALRFSGYINIGHEGVYTFLLSSDDGSALYIGDTRVVDNDGTHDMREATGIIGLKAGKHAITLVYFQGGYGKGLSVGYACQAAGIAAMAIPDGVLFREPVDAPQPIRVTAPNGGETFAVNDQITIEWTADESIDNVVIMVSPDDGEYWYSITDTVGIHPGDPGWGAFPWTVPDTIRSTSGSASLVSNQCLVKIEKYDKTVSDVSDAWFAIAAGSTVRSGAGSTVCAHASIQPLPAARGLAITAPYAAGEQVRLLDMGGRIVASGMISPDGTCCLRVNPRGGLYAVQVGGVSRKVLLHAAKR